jgi:hypothetical protein
VESLGSRENRSYGFPGGSQSQCAPALQGEALAGIPVPMRDEKEISRYLREFHLDRLPISGTLGAKRLTRFRFIRSLKTPVSPLARVAHAEFQYRQFASAAGRDWSGN